MTRPGIFEDMERLFKLRKQLETASENDQKQIKEEIEIITKKIADNTDNFDM